MSEREEPKQVLAGVEAPAPPRPAMDYARMPHAAAIDTISDADYRCLAAVIHWMKGRDWRDATDSRIGDRCGKEARTASRLVGHLVAAGWLERETHGPFRILRRPFDYFYCIPHSRSWFFNRGNTLRARCA